MVSYATMIMSRTSKKLIIVETLIVTVEATEDSEDVG